MQPQPGQKVVRGTESQAMPPHLYELSTMYHPAPPQAAQTRQTRLHPAIEGPLLAPDEQADKMKGMQGYEQLPYLLTSKKSRAPPVPSRWADTPVRMRDSSGLKQQPVSECMVGSPVKTCTGAFSLRRSHTCRHSGCMADCSCGAAAEGGKVGGG